LSSRLVSEASYGEVERGSCGSRLGSQGPMMNVSPKLREGVDNLDRTVSLEGANRGLPSSSMAMDSSPSLTGCNTASMSTGRFSEASKTNSPSSIPTSDRKISRVQTRPVMGSLPSGTVGSTSSIGWASSAFFKAVGAGILAVRKSKGECCILSPR
jgi:hypothetical protein